ncbi:putative ribonuclease H-like domain-containing protein [Tanacetum coccineum]
MRMEQYLQCIDYTLWEIIENGNAPIVTKTVDGKETVIPPTSVEEKAQRRAELKARSTLLMALPNEHQLKFNSYKDAKTLMQAIENRFGEVIEQTYERLQKLISQLEMHEIETLSLDDLFNNLKAYESEVKGTSNSNPKLHLMSPFCPLSTLTGAKLELLYCSGYIEDLQQINPDYLEEMDLRWNITRLTMRARRFLKNTKRKLDMANKERIGLDKSKTPRWVIQSMKDPSWIEAMQDELLQFKLQKVWTLVDLPNGKRAIGTKWVYRNKKDERGIVKNKARLVAQGYTQEEGIDYDEVYVDDIIFGSTMMKLCTKFEKMMHKKFQINSMGELTFFLGLQVKQKEDGIFISQDKYMTEILKKFGFSDVKTANTPIETHKPLLKDADGEDVDEHIVNAGDLKLMLLGINLLLLGKVNAARHKPTTAGEN